MAKNEADAIVPSARFFSLSCLGFLPPNRQLARMDVTFGKRLLPLLCCWIVVAGCGRGTWWWSSSPDVVVGVVSPTKRIQELRELAENAASKTPVEKQQIAERLAGEMHDRDALIRAQIVRTLGAFPCPTSDTILRAAVADPDIDVRMAACESWGKRGIPEAASILVGILNADIEHDVRVAAARALAHTHERIAVTALGSALEDHDPAMQYIAVLSLREITGQDLGNNVDTWRESIASGKLQPVQPNTSVAERLRQTF